MSQVRTPRRIAPAGAVDDSVFADAVVLVVDDHHPNLALLERILTSAGSRHIHLTTDPHSVVALYISLRPDLVMLDLHMPGMDGLAVMEAIRRETDDDDFVPIIVLTADATAEARERALAAGASDFLTKPMDRTEVVLRARNLLHTRTLHAGLRVHNAQLRSEIAARDAADELARAGASEKVRRLRRVLNGDTPRIVFQPIAQLDSRDLVGYEALARFDQEPHQPPNMWFAEATEVGLGIELEIAAVQLALHQMASVPEGVLLTLNVSPTTAMTAQFTELLARYPQDRLVLEITEHAQVEDYDALLTALTRLRGAGVRLAVDDAGAGFASLHHILLLTPDVIKLDITLVRDINQDPIKRALASSLVTFARDIGSTIIAEGIETAAELAMLVDLGVPWGQGYHLGRPGSLPTHPNA
jgi:EAL domain-containing protein (putative c-di-GMP-specific phosphodiesterase class I)/ActR/RegA family two-component response regulator